MDAALDSPRISVRLQLGREQRSVDAGSAARVAELAAAAAAAWPGLAPDFKLVLKGVTYRTQRDAEAPLLGLVDGARVLVVAPLAGAVSAVGTPPRVRVRDDLAGGGPSAAAPRAAAAKPPVASEFGFLEYRVLRGFDDGLRPDGGAALDFLHRLASDPGVVAVMRSHKLRVGVLGEMYPDGSVGVDPVCVLGLNTNRGASITLRLRTDDLLGFRKYATVLKTLYHELAHNILSEHTGAFYALVSQFEREGSAADWRRTTANTTGGGVAVYRRPPGGDARAAAAPPPNGHVLGGAALPVGRDAREAAAAAAEARRAATITTAAAPPSQVSRCSSCAPGGTSHASLVSSDAAASPAIRGAADAGASAVAGPPSVEAAPPSAEAAAAATATSGTAESPRKD